jgi:hypothetical protein
MEIANPDMMPNLRRLELNMHGREMYDVFDPSESGYFITELRHIRTLCLLNAVPSRAFRRIENASVHIALQAPGELDLNIFRKNGIESLSIANARVTQFVGAPSSLCALRLADCDFRPGDLIQSTLWRDRLRIFEFSDSRFGMFDALDAASQHIRDAVAYMKCAGVSLRHLIVRDVSLNRKLARLLIQALRASPRLSRLALTFRAGIEGPEFIDAIEAGILDPESQFQGQVVFERVGVREPLVVPRENRAHTALELLGI